jgi:hypothetical protein
MKHGPTGGGALSEADIQQFTPEHHHQEGSDS